MSSFLLLAAVAVRLYTPGEQLEGYEKVPPPQSKMRMSQASATTVPWVDANGWRFIRGVKKAFYEKVPAGWGALAMAEANTYGVDAVIDSAPEDAEQMKAMGEFLRRTTAPAMPAMTNINVVDDGTQELGEVMNLLGRRNLLYHAGETGKGLIVKVGTPQYPRESIANPNDFAARVREKLTDEKRLLRIYNSYTVIGHLTGDGTRARLHLLNYSKRPAKDVRVLVRGDFSSAKLAESADNALQATDLAVVKGGIEFTVPQLQTYAVVDLGGQHGKRK